MDSKSFGDKRALRPHLLRGGGKGAEIRDLRRDIDEAFRGLEEGHDAPAVLYVDPDGGDDKSAGTLLAPYKSLEKALRDWGDVVRGDPIIYVMPTSEVTGIVSEEFWRPRRYLGAAAIIGLGNDEVGPEVTLTSYSTLVYTFTGESWTEGEWSGYDLEATNGGPNEYPEPNNRRSIIWNTADTITIALAHRTTAGTYPVPNDTFRVVKPALKISTAQSVSGERRTLFGGQGVEHYRSYGVLKSSLRLENMELRAPDGDTDSFSLSGAFYLYGVHITKNTPSNLTVSAVNSSIQAGEWLSKFPRQYGWGLSLRDRGGNDVRPSLNMISSFGTLCYSGGGITFVAGGRFLLLAALVDGLGRTGFPHAAIYADTSHVFTGSSASEPNIYIRNFNSEYDVEAENGRIEIYKKLHHLGSGGIARSRTGGYTTLGAAPTIVGSLGVSSKAIYGGHIRITGWDGELLGDVEAGQVAPNPRAQAAWSPNETLEGSEGSWVYRTS